MPCARSPKPSGAGPRRAAASTTPFSLMAQRPARAWIAWAHKVTTRKRQPATNVVSPRCTDLVRMPSRKPASSSRLMIAERKSGRVVAESVLDLLQLTGRVGQDDPQRDLARVGEVRDPEGVTDLEVERELPRDGLLGGALDPVEIAVDPVDGSGADREPAAAVDPRPPSARLGQLRGSDRRRRVVRLPIGPGCAALRCPAAVGSTGPGRHRSPGASSPRARLPPSITPTIPGTSTILSARTRRSESEIMLFMMAHAGLELIRLRAGGARRLNVSGERICAQSQTKGKLPQRMTWCSMMGNHPGSRSPCKTESVR